MKGILKYLLLLAFAGGVGPASAAFWQWSTTASTNTAVDPSVNWGLSMAPSAVGPSMRAMMARTAEWRDDISGSLLTTGSSTAYVVTTNEAAAGNGVCATTTPVDGQMITITPHVTNGFQPSITVDGCTSAPIASGVGVFMPAGVMVAFTPYVLKYSLATAIWSAHNFYTNPLALPLGALMAYTGTSVPNGNYVFPAGQCLSTTTFATYWALLGSPAPGACSAGNFQVIDLRGRALAALDNLNGTPANLLTNTAAGCGTAMNSVGSVCANGAEAINLPVAQIPSGITFANTQSISVIGNAGNTFLFDGSMVGGGTSGSTSQPFNGAYFNTYSMTSNNSISGTTSNTSGANVPKVQPTIAVTYILRVL